MGEGDGLGGKLKENVSQNELSRVARGKENRGSNERETGQKQCTNEGENNNEASKERDASERSASEKKRTAGGVQKKPSEKQNLRES